MYVYMDKPAFDISKNKQYFQMIIFSKTSSIFSFGANATVIMYD